MGPLDISSEHLKAIKTVLHIMQEKMKYISVHCSIKWKLRVFSTNLHFKNGEKYQVMVCHVCKWIFNFV